MVKPDNIAAILIGSLLPLGMVALTKGSMVSLVAPTKGSIMTMMSLVCLVAPTKAALATSCTGLGTEAWGRRGVAARLRSWLRSGVTLAGEGEVSSSLYDPLTREFLPHFAGHNDRLELDEDGEEEETNRRVVTIAQFGEDEGVVWQWRGRREEEGWLYWKQGEGKVIFLYPDLLTGLEGRWREEVLEEAREVRVVAERCR